MAALLSAYPETAREKDKGGKLPLHYAAGSKASIEVLLPLVLLDLPILPGKDVSLDVKHQHSWTYFIDVTKDDPDKSKAGVEAIFKDHFHSSRQHCLVLARTKDELGREAIVIANADVQQLMHSYIFFCGMYELQQGPPVHRSATAVVLAATNNGQPGKPRVAIKFMRSEEQCRRERSVRANSSLSGSYVVGLLEGPSEAVFAEEVKGLSMHDGRSLAEYRHGLVMPFADRSLDEIVKKERPDMLYIKVMMHEVAEALQHCHERGVTHGDLKMLNGVRVGAAIKLIDLDAAAVISQDPACAKFSSGVLPPEMFYELQGAEEERLFAAYFADFASEGGEEWDKIRPSEGIVVRTFLPSLPPEAHATLPYALVPASATMDVWAYGAMLYHMSTGEPLLPVNRDDDLIDGAGRRQAMSWTDAQLRRKVGNAPIPGDALLARLVKDLLKLVLRPDPAQRVSLQSVLAHPFFTGQVPSRLSAEASVQWDVFISYRVDSDAAIAMQMHDKLTARGLRVWLDVKCLLPGVSWEEGFCNGLMQSRCLMPILSRKAIKARFEALAEDSASDSVLLEYRLAGELQQRGMVERVFPLFVGDLHPTMEGSYGDYFEQGCHPAPPSGACVASVEAKLRKHLERQGLGLPLRPRLPVRDVLGDVTVSQGGKVAGAGSLDGLLGAQADTILDMVRALDSGSHAARPGLPLPLPPHAQPDTDPAMAQLTLSTAHLALSSAREEAREYLRRLDVALGRVAELEAELGQRNAGSPAKGHMESDM